MRASACYVLAGLVLAALFSSVQGGCKQRSITLVASEAEAAAVNAVTSAFAQCTVCPCKISATSEARVVSQDTASRMVNTTRTKTSGKCADGSVATSAEASATPTDVANTLVNALAESISRACNNEAWTDATLVQRSLNDAAAEAQGTAASNNAVAQSTTSTISSKLEGVLADSLSAAAARCKCSGKKPGDTAQAKGGNGSGKVKGNQG